MRVRKVLRWSMVAAALLVVPPAGYVYWVGQVRHNFGTPEPGRLYRSGQMPAGSLAEAVRAHGIKTVLNLRGANPGRAWYRGEFAASRGAGATQVDLSMSSCEWLSRDQLRTLIGVLDTSEYPMLVHCQFGSERTGLACAVATLLRPGATLDDARSAFSLRHLFLPVKDGKVMADHLEEYARWLAGRRLGHTPSRFREWAATDYRPHSPNRDEWPYNPIPLVVRTPPDPAAPARR